MAKFHATYRDYCIAAGGYSFLQEVVYFLTDQENYNNSQQY